MAIAGAIPMTQQHEEEEEEKDSHEHDMVMPGFRFHPTEEELIEFYLRRKVEGKRFNVELITFLDLYRYDPWELPALAAIGEKEWYFYVPRDRKYRNGDRPNRVTTSGYWKATGADRMIRTDNLRSIGLKKTLVFYSGKAPKGIRSSWIMNEYRLPHHDTDRYQKAEISLCRVYKRAGVDDHHSSSSINPRSHHHHSSSTSSKPIIIQSSSSSAAAAAGGGRGHKQAPVVVDCTTSTSTTGSFQSLDRQSPPLPIDLAPQVQLEPESTDGIDRGSGGIGSIITTLGLTVTAVDFSHKATPNSYSNVTASTPSTVQQLEDQQQHDGTLLHLHHHHQQHPHYYCSKQYGPSSLFVPAAGSTNFFMTSNTTTTSSSMSSAISTVDELRRVVDCQQQFYAHQQQQQQQQQHNYFHSSSIMIMIIIISPNFCN
ncbi:hypothetical protein Sjap_021243 [Stephania japonica]|uniref:NAC domain-containing protein n=1 Tax=Stephania japonica TaxID=461633 RepID=A0AAP0HTA5_9MAGN